MDTPRSLLFSQSLSLCNNLKAKYSKIEIQFALILIYAASIIFIVNSWQCEREQISKLA